MYAMIATWAMSLEGVKKAARILRKDGSAMDALETAIQDVEACEYYKSVGYGGLPNAEGVVELDAACMDGNTLAIGAVAAMQNILHPVSVARKLMKESVNNVLAGQGAQAYALQHGFSRENLLSKRAEILYQNRKAENSELKAYSGHDTVGMCALDENSSMAAAVSTSGLFIKHAGRVGDSPLPGCGYYADSDAGAAAATGLGEDILKGCLSYEIVRLMEEGLHPQKACEKALHRLQQKLETKQGFCRDLSVVALDRNGNWGAATNLEEFSFVLALPSQKPAVFLCRPEKEGTMYIEPASEEWVERYEKTRQKPVMPINPKEKL